MYWCYPRSVSSGVRAAEGPIWGDKDGDGGQRRTYEFSQLARPRSDTAAPKMYRKEIMTRKRQQRNGSKSTITTLR